MIVGILFPYYWKKKTDVNLMFFLYGIIMWFIVVFIKSLIDFGILNMFGNLFNPLGTGILIACVYVGLKTGLLESGLSYVFVLKKKLKMDFDRAVAFGLGFGCIEAFLLGLSSFTTVAIFMFYPQMLDLLSAELRESVVAQLNASSWIVFAPIIERIFTVFAHVFAMVLLICAVHTKKIEYLILSVFYKAMLDGPLPWLQSVFDTSTVTGVYMIELFVVIMGTIGFVGTRRLRQRFKGHRVKPLKWFA